MENERVDNVWKGRLLMKPVVLKLREDAIIPTKREADSGYDLYAVWDKPVVVHKTQEVMVFPTGLKMRFPSTHTALFRDRGSTGIRNMQVRAGVVEGNYSGEYKILLSNGNEFEDILYVKDEYAIQDLIDTLHVSYPFYGWDKLSHQNIKIKKDELGRDFLMDATVKCDDPVKYYLYPQSKAIAQMILIKKEDWEWEEVNETEYNSIPTDRGEGWNGSSGK